MKNFLVPLMALTMILLVGCQGGSDLTDPTAQDNQRAVFSPLQDAAVGDYVWYDDNMDNPGRTINYRSYTRGLRIKDVKTT